MTDFATVIGTQPDVWCHGFWSKRPKWVSGAIGYRDTCFLFKTTLMSHTDLAVEIGTASGYSTGVLCYALHFASLAGVIAPDYQVISYDIIPQYYADKSRKVGDATREQLPPELMEHIIFRHPARASDIRQFHGPDEIKLLFIDASHRHPWPTLDLIASLDSLSPNAIVVLHDINLPILGPEWPDWGAKHLFDGLDLEKDVPREEKIPNIGSIIIPEDKEALREQLMQILFAHEWQVDVSEDYLNSIGVSRRPSP